MSTVVTFVLPTMNRRPQILRAVESCLAIASPRIVPHVLIVDGTSTDGTWELLVETYGDDQRVTLTRNATGTGYQRSAFEGAAQVASDWATFMYDDDVLSPEFGRLIEAMLDADCRFAMGYGAHYPVAGRYDFKALGESTQVLDGASLTRAYFGFTDAVASSQLPVNPICAVLPGPLLREWVGICWRFVAGSRFRQYFVIERNIGCDLLTYLVGIRRAGKALLADRVLAQFSEHPRSMSLEYGWPHLQIGYWLARIWLVDECLRDGDIEEAAACGLFVVLEGAKIAVKSLGNRERRWFFAIASEVLGLTGRLLVGCGARRLLWMTGVTLRHVLRPAPLTVPD
jgi:hypothetical protein